MSFLQPLILFALPAAFLPLLIHLLHRRRFPEKSWGAMMFLQEAMHEQRGRQHLRRRLLLASRILMLVFLILAVSGPIGGRWLQGWLGGHHQTIGILLDRSASMARQLPAQDHDHGKLQAGLTLLATTWRQIQPHHVWLLDSASGQRFPLDDPSHLHSLFPPTDTAANLPALLLNALDSWEASSGELWILSDLQSSSWHPEDHAAWDSVRNRYAALSHPPLLRLLTLTGGQDNRSIRAQAFPGRLDVIIDQPSDSPSASIPLTLKLGEQESVQEITLSGAHTEITLDLPVDSVTPGWVSIPADGNSRDNQAPLVARPPASPRALLICQDPEVEAILELALAPWPPGHPSNAEIQSASLETVTTDGPADLVIFQGTSPAEPFRQALQDRRRRGESLLLLPPAESSTAQTWGKDISFLPTLTLSPDAPERVSDWPRSHGPLRDTASGEPLPVDRWLIRRYAPLSLPDHMPTVTLTNGDTLAAFPNENRETAAGTLAICGTLPLDSWSTLDEGLVLVPLLQRLLEHGQGNRLGYTTTAPEAPPWHAGVFPQPTPDHYQVYQRPPAEDEPQEITPETLRRLLGTIPYHSLAMKGAADSEGALTPWWRLAFLLTLVFLLAESLLAARPKPRPSLTTPSVS